MTSYFKHMWLIKCKYIYTHGNHWWKSCYCKKKKKHVPLQASVHTLNNSYFYTFSIGDHTTETTLSVCNPLPPNKGEERWHLTKCTVLICHALSAVGPTDTVRRCWHQIGQTVKRVCGCKWQRWHSVETLACTCLPQSAGLGMRSICQDGGSSTRENWAEKPLC